MSARQSRARAEVLREASAVASDMARRMYESGPACRELAKGAGAVAGELERMAVAAERGERS